MFLRIYWITLNGSFENRLQRLRHLLANVKEETNAAHRMELSDMRHDTACNYAKACPLVQSC